MKIIPLPKGQQKGLHGPVVCVPSNGLYFILIQLTVQLMQLTRLSLQLIQLIELTVQLMQLTQPSLQLIKLIQLTVQLIKLNELIVQIMQLTQLILQLISAYNLSNLSN